MLSRRLARAFVARVSRLSPTAVARWAGRLGRLAYALGIRRRVTLGNLARALPEQSLEERARIARGAYTNMARAFLEGLAATRLTDEEVQARVVVENGHLLDQAMAQGKGMLVATAHFGSWELLGEVMARRGVPLHAVVRPLKGALNAELVASRTQNGLRLIPPRGAVRSSVAALAKGEVVTMLIDQVLPARHGVFVPFFGQPACTNPALSWAALRSGAPVVLVMAAREGDRLRMFVEGPFPVPPGERQTAVTAHTALLTAAIERYIRRYPDQWLWLHRRWKVQPPARAALHAQAQPEP